MAWMVVAARSRRPMDRESPKRRLTWFGKRTPQSGNGPDASMASSAREQAESQAKVSRWPTLPKWSPLPGGAMGSVDDESLATSNETHQTDHQLAPPWEQAASDTSEYAERPPFTPWRFWSASRSQQVGLGAIVGIVILAVLLSRILLGDIFPSDRTDTASITPTPGHAVHVVAPSTMAAPTPDPTSVPSPTAAPVRTTPAPSFTVAFTCVSGAIFGRGMVCVHTKPDAMVSL